MKDFVVYTVMVGSYGKIYQPRVVDDRFDYVLFSNEMVGNVGVWQVKPIPQVVEDDPKRLSRYPKSHPEELLSEYKASLYIDANVQIADKWVYDRCVELADKSIELAGIQLLATGRDCIYLHAMDMCVMKLEHDYNAIKQMRALYKAGFPQHYGLNENNIIFRMNTLKMKLVDEEWWWWIKNYSYRDQFSFMYCLWKFDIKREFFLPMGEDSHNSAHFIYNEHNNNIVVFKKKKVAVDFFEKSRNNWRRHFPFLASQWWMIMCKSTYPYILLKLENIVAFPFLPLAILKRWHK